LFLFVVLFFVVVIEVNGAFVQIENVFVLAVVVVDLRNHSDFEVAPLNGCVLLDLFQNVIDIGQSFLLVECGDVYLLLRRTLQSNLEVGVFVNAEAFFDALLDFEYAVVVLGLDREFGVHLDFLLLYFGFNFFHQQVDQFFGQIQILKDRVALVECFLESHVGVVVAAVQWVDHGLLEPLEVDVLLHGHPAHDGVDFVAEFVLALGLLDLLMVIRQFVGEVHELAFLVDGDHLEHESVVLVDFLLEVADLVFESARGVLLHEAALQLGVLPQQRAVLNLLVHVLVYHDLHLLVFLGLRRFLPMHFGRYFFFFLFWLQLFT